MSVETVKLGGESAEQVAYKLMMDVSQLENGFKDRKSLLDTYAECLRAVHHPAGRIKPQSR
jgi:hypothetical protein